MQDIFHYRTSSASSGRIEVIDHRTGNHHHFTISNNAVRAADLQAVNAGTGYDVAHRMKSGLRILDPGFENTAVMKSEITFVDGINGTIHYRKHSIDDLFGKHNFEEVAHLLIWGHLPSEMETEQFRMALVDSLDPPSLVIETIRGFPPESPPFSMVLAGLAAYAASDPSSIPTAAGDSTLYPGKVKVVDKAITRTISSMAAIIALVYCQQHNKIFTVPIPEKPFIDNFLIMMGFVEDKTKMPNPKVVKSLERLWILYCDHEMTNSTAAFLHVASTLADPISCCMAFIASGNGPLHAGAIDLAYKAFARLGSPDKVPAMISDVKAKKYRLFGYGHRIYKTVDPRTKYIKAMLDELVDETAHNPLFAVAMEIDRIASQDRYFTTRNLKANADLYGCFVYTALGFEPDIVTAVAMLSRMPGVMAHWREFMSR
ncbi:citrate synthase [Usnea florida]